VHASGVDARSKAKPVTPARTTTIVDVTIGHRRSATSAARPNRSVGDLSHEKLPDCTSGLRRRRRMSLGGGGSASYFGPTSDPFQFAAGRHSDARKFDAKQSRMMYDDCRANGFGDSFGDGLSFSAAAATTTRPSVGGYEYVPSRSYPLGQGGAAGYGAKTTGPGGLAYAQALDRVHGHSINHVATPPPPSHSGLPPGFAIYPWMRSMTAGMGQTRHPCTTVTLTGR